MYYSYLRMLQCRITPKYNTSSVLQFALRPVSMGTLPSHIAAIQSRGKLQGMARKTRRMVISGERFMLRCVNASYLQSPTMNHVDPDRFDGCKIGVFNALHISVQIVVACDNIVFLQSIALYTSTYRFLSMRSATHLAELQCCLVSLFSVMCCLQSRVVVVFLVSCGVEAS